MDINVILSPSRILLFKEMVWGIPKVYCRYCYHLYYCCSDGYYFLLHSLSRLVGFPLDLLSLYCRHQNIRPVVSLQSLLAENYFLLSVRESFRILSSCFLSETISFDGS